MIAAKHFDPVIGIDVHIIQPPGTVPPVPVPHPFVGIVLDPFDYLPLIGATVLINGLPRGQGGSLVTPVVPHVPIGGVFVKPPENEAELLMGSSTVVVEDEPFTYLGLPVLSCSDIGAPPPPRPPKAKPGDTKPPKPKPPKGGPMALLAPTSVVLSIPMGQPVLVGGAPTVSMTGLAFAGAVTAFRGLRKLQRQSDKVRQVSARMHRRAELIMDSLGVSDRTRDRIHTAICTVTGHPVDVATGKVFTEVVDLDLPGPLPLVLERKWLSTSGYRGPLGHGWHHNHDYELRVHPPGKMIALRLADGRARAFPLLDVGERYFDRKEKLELVREPGGYVLHERAGLIHRFEQECDDRIWPATGVEDRAGNRIQLVRDSGGRLTEIRDSGGRRFPVVSDDAGRIVEIRGPHPTSAGDIPHVRYVYDRAGDLVEAYDVLGRVRRYEYRDHLLIRETDRAGLSFYFEYDRNPDKPAITARCVRTWGDGGIFDHALEYEDGHTIVTDSLGARDTYYFNEQGLVERAVDALGHSARAEFDEYDNELESTDELGRTTHHVYDERGNRMAQIWPDGTTAFFAHDEHDELVRAIDQNGGWWQWKRDERGRLLERLQPDGGRAALVWRGNQVVSVIDDRGGITELQYDPAGNLVRAQAPDGGVTQWKHDRLGRPVASQSPTGAVQQLRRDAAGQVIEVHEPDGTRRRLEHDGEGRPVTIREPERTIELSWVGMGRLAAKRIAGVETSFDYDTEQRLIGLRNAHGEHYRFERDARGQVVAEIGWAGDRREFQRDAAGQIVELTRASGARAVYTWTRAGKLERVVYDDGSFEQFGYRADGLLAFARNGMCTIKLERDALGRITREWQDERWIASSYDRAGNRTNVRSSFGTRVDIEVDAMGRWSGIGLGEGSDVRWRATTQRNLVGDEVDRHLPGGARDRWGRDQLGRPAQHQVWDGRAVVRDVRYTWNVDARLNRLLDTLTGVPTEYGHDVLGQLAWARKGQDTAELRLPDALGNIYRSGERVDRHYGADGRLLFAEEAAGTTRYEYDADGQRVLRRDPDGGEWKYRWNRAGRLVAVERPDGVIVEFGYDALGRRVWKRCGGRTTRWVWDGDAIFHEWTETTEIVGGQEPIERTTVLPGSPTRGPVTARGPPLPSHGIVGEDESTGYVEPAFVPRKLPQATMQPAPRGLITWLSDPETLAPMAKLVEGRAYSVVCDHLGTPIAMLDESGRRVWAMETTTWGERRIVQGEAGDCPFRFLGQVEDLETRLYYNRFREYDPRAGQYLCVDPIRLAGGINSFAYVGDPLVEVDPLGLAKRQGREPCVPRRLRDQIEALRSGQDVVVYTVEDARELLALMPELRPATQEHLTPNPSGKIANGFKDPPGTYRGDLINKNARTENVHPKIKNRMHAENPHYNIRFPNKTKAAIIILI